MSETHYIHHDPEGDPLHIAPSEDTPGARLLLPQYPAWWDVRREDAPAVCRDILAAAGSTARVVEEIEPTGTDTLTWDWRSQPDLDRLAEILGRHGVTLRQVDTGSDSYEIAISGGGIPRASDSADTGIDLEAIRQRDSAPLVYSPEGYITLAEDRTALLAEIERLTRERDDAVEHDRQVHTQLMDCVRRAQADMRERAARIVTALPSGTDLSDVVSAIRALPPGQQGQPDCLACGGRDGDCSNCRTPYDGAQSRMDWQRIYDQGRQDGREAIFRQVSDGTQPAVCEVCGSPEYDHIRRSEDDRLDCPAQPAYRRLAAVERELADLRERHVSPPVDQPATDSGE